MKADLEKSNATSSSVTVQRTYFFLAGDSWPADRFVEVALRERLNVSSSDRFVGHEEVLEGILTIRMERRAELLIQAVRKYTSAELIIIGRSSGARVATLVAGDLAANCERLLIVALAYPFKHPEVEMEPERFAHLASLQAPTLIVQGARDEYGGIDIRSRYSLSPATEVMFVDEGHHLRLGPQDWDRVAYRIKLRAETLGFGMLGST